MKYKDQLIERISQRTGCDARAIVDDLYSTGAMDEIRARRYMAVTDFPIEYGKTDQPARQVMHAIGERHGMDMTSVFKALRNTQSQSH